MCVCVRSGGEGGHNEIQYGEARREQGSEEDVSGRTMVKKEGRN